MTTGQETVGGTLSKAISGAQETATAISDPGASFFGALKWAAVGLAAVLIADQAFNKGSALRSLTG